MSNVIRLDFNKADRFHSAMLQAEKAFEQDKNHGLDQAQELIFKALRAEGYERGLAVMERILESYKTKESGK